MKLMIMVSRVPWPLDKGDKLRIYHQIKHLSYFHEIHLVALSENKDDSIAREELLKYCQSVTFYKLSKIGISIGMLQSLFNGKPFQIGYFYNRTIHSKIRKIVKVLNPDHIYTQLVRVAEYTKDLKIERTLDLQDAFSSGLKRRAEKAKGVMKLLLRSEYKRMKRYEKECLNGFKHLTIITQADKDLMCEEVRDRIQVIPNGVDFNFFQPVEKSKEFDLVFTGNMSYPPNVMAAEFLAKEVMPIIWETLPNVKLLLAGASPNNNVTRLASSKITVSGWMEDIRDAYAKAKIFVAPMLIGTGLQNKLLEAMSMNLPCVTSELANKALKAIPNESIIEVHGRDVSQYANQIIQLLSDKEKADKIAFKGNEYVTNNYDWMSSVKKLNNLLG